MITLFHFLFVFDDVEVEVHCLHADPGDELLCRHTPVDFCSAVYIDTVAAAAAAAAHSHACRL